MKIIVLNGSPKGDISVTMQYVHYIEKHFKNHELKIINISQRINQIEKDEKIFNEIIEDINSSDGVIWAFPLYFCLVSSQYKRFIELISERNVEYAFKGKYTSIIATSVHFFDHTAISYMNSICDDLDMKFVDYFSLHMFDLEKEDIRKNLLKFAQNYFDSIENNKTTLKNYKPLIHSKTKYIPENNYPKIDTLNKKIIIIADSLKDDNLKNMILNFKNMFSTNVELVVLEDINIKGGCLGCLKCAHNYNCAYENKDEFIDFYNNKVKTADIIIFAGAIKDRYLSSTWKKFFDRSFFNTHTPSIQGKQLGFIISGPLNQIPNLKQILEGYSGWQKANIIEFISDDEKNSKEIDESLQTLAKNSIELSSINYSKPLTFLGIGGWKIFRDEMWGELRFPFIADYKAYKNLGVYDFPQKNYKSRIKNFILITIVKLPFIRKEIFSNRLKSDIVQRLTKVLNNPNI